MPTYSIIQKSQLEGANRLDAEYYQPEYLEMENLLYKSKTDSILHLTNFVKKGVFDLSPENYLTEGIPFVRVQNIKNGFLDEQNLVFISQNLHKKEYKTELNSFDIVFSKVGTVGEVSFIPSHFTTANFSQNVIGIKIYGLVIPKGYLLFFLLSKFGQLQIARANMLQVQAKLELKDIRNLKVIRLGEKENYFHQELLKIENLFENSKSLYSQAENLLLEELGLKDFESGNELWSVVNLSETKKVNRIDAEYFDPKYQNLIDKVKKGDSLPLGELATLKKGFEPGSEEYQEEGKLFIRVSSISKDGITDKDQKYLKDELYNKLKKDYEPKVGEILLTKDASPGIAYVVKEPIDGIVAGGVLRLKPKENVETEYLMLVINSLVGQLQVERDAGGSVIAHWKPEQVKQLLVPILPKPAQQKIAELVQKSYEARKKAKELLEEAKRKIEELIDKK